MPNRKKSYRFIDLFAGIGGFHLAFARAGCNCVFASEIDKFARETYKANHKFQAQSDIKKIIDVDREIEDHDILAAGFPCQPFSLAGVSKYNALGLEHGFRNVTKGTLFFDIVRILEAKRPRAFLLENVKNIINHDGGKTFDVILETLTHGLKYHVSYSVVDAAQVVPQHRERVFLVGFRDPVAFSPPVFTGKKPALGDILQKSVDPKYTLTPKLWQYLKDYRIKHESKGHGFGYTLVDPKNQSVITRTLSARYYKDGSEILLDQGSGKRPRRLTPAECQLLMGFPADFVHHPSDTQSYRQFGNAVVVPVAEAFAKQIVASLSRLDARRGSKTEKELKHC